MIAKVKLINNGIMPVMKHKGDACFDCYANESVSVENGKRVTVALGFAMELPEGYELQVRPRSGNSSKGIDVTLGTGDESYRGEYKATVVNNTGKKITISRGDRICQVAIREVPQFELVEVSELSDTERGDKGFGSSGMRG